MSEERFVDIEIKLTRQEDLLDELNRTVFRQQQQIEQLEALCATLGRHLKELAQTKGDPMPANEKPPHY